MFVFLFCIGEICVFSLHGSSGESISVLKGHLNSVNAITQRRSTQDVVSTGKDGLILLWQPKGFCFKLIFMLNRKKLKNFLSPSLSVPSSFLLMHFPFIIHQKSLGISSYDSNLDRNILQDDWSEDEVDGRGIVGEENDTHLPFLPPILRQVLERAGHILQR